MGDPSIAQLHSLARLYDVQPSYYDVTGARTGASTAGLLAILRALGAPVSTEADVPSALRERRQALWREPTEPVVVAWQGRPASLELRLPARLADRAVDCALRLESGGILRWSVPPSRRRTLHRAEVEGQAYLAQRVPLPARSLGTAPAGYHELSLTLGRDTVGSQLLLAPVQAYRPPGTGRGGRRTWGVFLPLYALHSARSLGAGDFGDLRRLMDWVGHKGGGLVATLPLLAAFLDLPYDPSPYAPASRLFWNEFYVDLDAIPELPRCAEARRRLEAEPFRAARRALRDADLVDYRRQMRVKRDVLQALAKNTARPGAPGAEAFHRFVRDHPALEDYARFRALGERYRAPWQAWPSGPRDGRPREDDSSPRVRTYHLYAQWVAQEQLTALAERAAQSGEGLYLDLPLGVHGHGYDVWRERDSFVLEATGGAPPDAVFTKGQDWGFAPLHPQGIRQSRYRYVLAYLRHHMRLARVLRIDHVMGLHRLYMIPRGLEAREGVLVRYRAEELYAILSLESHRHRTRLVGENLGTVPAHVNGSLARHRVDGMYVVQYEMKPSGPTVLRPIPRRTVASMNTHDMPPFAAYCQGLDLVDRVGMGLMNEREAVLERQRRRRMVQRLGRLLRRGRWLAAAPAGPGDLLRGCLAMLSASRAPLVLINLEDLWLETEPQNVPDSKESRPNWARKARYSFEAFATMPAVLELLELVDGLRNARPGKKSSTRAQVST